jgi:hypothetical protein
MGIRATAAGELARVDQTTNGSTLFDVAIKTKRGMVNITGFSSDPNAGKAFKTGDVVCMQGNATFKEFNDDVTFQMSKVSVSHVKEVLPYVRIEADGRLARAVLDECDDGTELYKLQLDIRTNVRRDPHDPKFDVNDRSTQFHKVDIPLFALCIGPAFTQAETLVEEEASRASLSGYLEFIEPLWVENCDFPCIQMICLKATAGAAATDSDWWTSKPKKPSLTTLTEPVLIKKSSGNSGPNDALPF